MAFGEKFYAFILLCIGIAMLVFGAFWALWHPEANLYPIPFLTGYLYEVLVFVPVIVIAVALVGIVFGASWMLIMMAGMAGSFFLDSYGGFVIGILFVFIGWFQLT